MLSSYGPGCRVKALHSCSRDIYYSGFTCSELAWELASILLALGRAWVPELASILQESQKVWRPVNFQVSAKERGSLSLRFVSF